MNKKIRNAVRTYLIKDNKVVAIKYKQQASGYYDIPGGKIESNETKEEASIREFKEETGMIVTKQHLIGNIYVEYPDRIFNFSVFAVDNYQGAPLDFKENEAMWIDIDYLLNEQKIFPSVKAIKYLKDNIDLKIECDNNHNILNIIEE